MTESIINDRLGVRRMLADRGITADTGSAFAERIASRSGSAFAERIASRSGSAFAERIASRSGSAFAERIASRSGSAFAERVASRLGSTFAGYIMDASGVLFAGRMIAEHTGFGAYYAMGTELVFYKERQGGTPGKSLYELLLRFYMTWQNYVKTGQKFYAGRDTLAQAIVKKLERRLGEKSGRDQRVPMYRELTVFRNIASIFVNRGSRPDLAKKAERELVKILSREFYEGGHVREHRENKVYKKQENRQEIVSTKRMIGTLEEQLKLQKTVVTELERKVRSFESPPQLNMNKIAGEVMRQMEREMHLERLRRGL